jgi:hypothetical protein
VIPPVFIVSYRLLENIRLYKGMLDKCSNDNRHIKDFERPTLDEQEIVFVNEGLQRSIYTKCLIKLKVYDFNCYREITGKVVRMDYQLKQVKFDMGEEWDWIKLLDITKAGSKIRSGRMLEGNKKSPRRAPLYT